ncbi:MAG TPA: hypothetical protein VLG12_01920 [Candidatus Saccharimonadales bacterium]|nr:hypothetical protein [Candidatus Saccharimonadales bacterium]
MDEKILKILDALQQGQERLEKGQKELQTDVSGLKIDVNRLKIDVKGLMEGQIRLEQIAGSSKTAIETLQAGQDDIREQLAQKANKADILDLKAEMIKKIKQHEKRLDDAGIANPYKN